MLDELKERSKTVTVGVQMQNIKNDKQNTFGTNDEMIIVIVVNHLAISTSVFKLALR